MKILIIEDEHHAVQQLKTLIRDTIDNPKIVEMLDTVDASISFLKQEPELDLIFLDIYLADSISFEIFQNVQVDIPIIFTTAYDEYAIQAFDLNSSDYLLKPIRKERFQKAMDKFHRLADRRSLVMDNRALEKIMQAIQQEKSHREHFLLSHRDRMVPVSAEEFAWFEIRNEVVRGMTADQRQFIMDESLQELEEQLDPQQFYRANRQVLINRDAIIDIEPYFNGRLLVNLKPAHEDDVIISKARAGKFKGWMNRC